MVLTINMIQRALSDKAFLDEELLKIRWEASQQGFIRIISQTQAEWTEEGIERAKKELKWEPAELKVNAQILFNRPNCLIVGRIVELREKAVKMDYCLDPISVYSKGSNAVIYTNTCWVPKSVLKSDEYGIGFEVKKWFEKAFKGGPRIKNYMVTGQDKIVLI